MSDILKVFSELNTMGIDEDGIRIPNAVAENVNGSFDLLALALPPNEAYAAIKTYLLEKRPPRFVFGLDRFTKPGQGFEWNDFLSVHYFEATAVPAWKFGAIEYRFVDGKAEVKPITWDNEFVKERIAQETRLNLFDQKLLSKQ